MTEKEWHKEVVFGLAYTDSPRQHLPVGLEEYENRVNVPPQIVGWDVEMVVPPIEPAFPTDVPPRQYTNRVLETWPPIPLVGILRRDPPRIVPMDCISNSDEPLGNRRRISPFCRREPWVWDVGGSLLPNCPFVRWIPSKIRRRLVVEWMSSSFPQRWSISPMSFHPTLRP